MLCKEKVSTKHVLRCNGVRDKGNLDWNLATPALELRGDFRMNTFERPD